MSSEHGQQKRRPNRRGETGLRQVAQKKGPPVKRTFEVNDQPEETNIVPIPAQRKQVPEFTPLLDSERPFTQQPWR
jgi:hypothetical protein